MKRKLTITNQPINEATLLRERNISDGMGAVIYFLGVVRGTEGEKNISAIEYEAFQKMVEHQFHILFDAMESAGPLNRFVWSIASAL